MGGSACCGNGSVLRSLRLGNSALCVCFRSQPDQTRPPGSIGLFSHIVCENCCVVKQNSPNLTAASHSPFPQHAEPPVTTRQHSQLFNPTQKFPEEIITLPISSGNFFHLIFLYYLLKFTNLPQYVPCLAQLCFAHGRLPMNRILICLLFCSLPACSALIFLADVILQTVSY